MEVKPARMRTIKASMAEIKALDADTAVTEWFIRNLCKENKVKHYNTGKKILVNLDDLLKYLSFDTDDEA